MFLIIVLTITLLTAALPLLVKQLAPHTLKRKYYQSYDWLPALAGLLFVGSFFLPVIQLSSDTSTFQQHFVGGGIYTACLFIYFKNLLGLKFSWWVSLIILFAWVSSFGVASELLEFVVTRLSLLSIDTTDTDWDLVANTAGAFTGYSIFKLFRINTKPLLER